MAKKRSKKLIKWQASPDDAIRLAALRWFALQLESSAICLYATDKRSYAEMEAVLRTALKGLKGIKKTYGLAEDGDEDPCPDGFIRCKDGTCAPACDGIVDQLPWK